MHSDVLSNMGSKEMESLVDAFGVGPTHGIVCSLQSTTVFLEDSAMDFCRSGVVGVPKLVHFFQQPDKRQSVSVGFGHAHTFSFCGGQSND